MSGEDQIPNMTQSKERTLRGYVKNNLTRVYAVVFASMLLVFTALTFLITNAGVDQGAEHNIRVVQTTAGTITGPLTGAISRGFQGCCLRFSLTVMAFCAPFLLIGTMIQFIALPDRMWLRVMRMFLWSLGWLVWFMGGIVSFGHALS
jgi:hypothetical protein